MFVIKLNVFKSLPFGFIFSYSLNMRGGRWGVGREDFPGVGVKVIAYVLGICICAVDIHKTRYAAGGGEKNFLFFPSWLLWLV